MWGHVQFGRDFLTHGLDRSTTYSFTTRDYPWVNHENLSEILMALGFDTIGATGMVIVKCLIGLLVVTLVASRGQRVKAHVVSVLAACVLLSVSLVTGWKMRPQLMTFTLFALMIWLLDWCFRDWEGRWCLSFNQSRASKQESHRSSFFGTVREHAPSWSERWHLLWLLPPLFVVWANAHGGFVAGACVLMAYMTLRLFQLLWQYRSKGIHATCYLLLITFVTLGATLVNPYGIELHRWLIGSLGTPRPEIVEWQPLNFETPKGLIFGLVLLSVVGSAKFSRRNVDIPHLVILMLIGMQAIQHHRHVPFFAILFAFWWLPYIDSFLFNGLTDRRTLTLSENSAFFTSLGLALLCVMLSLRLCPQLKGIAVPKNRYPVDAFRFMSANGLTKGRIVTTYGWAQYVIGAFGSRRTEESGLLVGFDGRFRTCYPLELLDVYLDFELGNTQARYRSKESPAVDGTRALKLGEPHLVLAMRSQTPAIRTMIDAGEAGEWVPLYQDKLAQLWGKAFIYDDPDRKQYVPPEKRQLTERGSNEIVPWPAIPATSQ